MSGPHFRDYHLLLDEQADQIIAFIDPLAERVRKIGQTTIKSISHVSELASLKDNNADLVFPSDMINELIDDNRTMAEAMRKCHSLCDDKDDVATASLLEIYIDETERRTWFLFETSRAVDMLGH
jgi:starvation-inducible DNA-binding protein